MQDIVDELQEILKHLEDDEIKIAYIENVENRNEILDKKITLRKKIRDLKRQLEELEHQNSIEQIKMNHNSHMKAAIDLELMRRYLGRYRK